MIQSERSGDYGAAIQGDPAVAAFNSGEGGLPLTGGYESLERVQGEATINKIVVTVGAILIVGLVFLCFRLAYVGMQGSSAAKTLSGERYLDGGKDDSYKGAAAPIGASGLAPFIPSASAPRVSQPPAPLPVYVPTTQLGTAHLFTTAEEQANAIGRVSDCRAAYALSGELSNKWFAVVGSRGNSAGNLPSQGVNLTERAADGMLDANPAENSSLPRPLSSEEWRAIDTQIEGISSTVAFATQPTAFPDALQDISSGVGREMRVYLQTLHMALAAPDSSQQSILKSRAEAHRQKAGELLARLETAVKSDVSPANSNE